MTSMKLSLRQKRRIIYGLLGLMIVLAILSIVLESSWSDFVVIGGATAAIILNFAWWRCPSCGEWLGRDGGEYCRRCGEKIDYDEK